MALLPTDLFGPQGAAMTGTSIVISKVIDARTAYAVALQLYWTGATGTFSIQGSMDYQANALGNNVINDGNWDDLGITPASLPAGSAGHTLIDIAATGIAYVRVVYTNVSGTGILTGMGGAK